MRIVFWIIMIPIAVAVVVFAINNHQPVELDLWPVLFEPLPVLVYALALVCMIFGFFWGAFAAWMAAGRNRRGSRDLARQLENERREMAYLRTKLARLEGAEKAAAIPAPPADAA